MASEPLTDQEVAALVFSSGHIVSDGTGGRALRLHIHTCPTCSATLKTVERILAARSADMGARIRAALVVLYDEPLFVSGIRRAIENNTDGYGRGGDITHTPRPGTRGSGSCPGDNLTAWLDRLRALLDAAPAGSAEDV